MQQFIYRLCLILFSMMPALSNAAQCKGRDGQWYEYTSEESAKGAKTPPRAADPQEESEYWYQGGTLHKATTAQWREATRANKMATASDWLAATKWEGKLNSPRDFRRLKAKSAILVAALDNASIGDKDGKMQIASLAAMIILIANDLGP